MARFVTKHRSEIGLSPDALLFRGNQKVDYVRLRVIDFDANTLKENVINTVKEVLEYRDKNTVTWLNIDGLHNIELMTEITQKFELDPIILADVMNTQARPKAQEYDNCIRSQREVYFRKRRWF